MARGTFANIRLVNKLASKTGPRTLHVPSGEELDIYDAAMKYREQSMLFDTKLSHFFGKFRQLFSPRFLTKLKFL